MGISEEAKRQAEEQISRLQKEISYDTKDYPIEVLVDNFREGEFYIPEYQRNFIWDEKEEGPIYRISIIGFTYTFYVFF